VGRWLSESILDRLSVPCQRRIRAYGDKSTIPLLFTYMINGLCIDVSAKELKAHLAARADHHEQKADWYKTQAATLSEGGVSTGMSNDPVRSLEQSAQQHREKAAYFRFMEQHIIENETYRLSQDDLSQIELSSRYYPGVRY
jgi:hypothetical protein